MGLVDRTGADLRDPQGRWQPWVHAVVRAWDYPVEIREWFLAKLTEVPEDAGVAGGFATSLFSEARTKGEDLPIILQRLRFARPPSKFKLMPLDHYLLSAVEVAHRLGKSTSIAGDMATIYPAVEHAMFAALIRRTLPGLSPGARLGVMLQLIARAFSGVLYSHARIQPVQIPEGWVMQHRQDYNFLAEHFYAPAYFQLTGGDTGPVADVAFDWVAPAACDVVLHERPGG